MKTIGFYVSPGFQMLDLAGPAGAFEAANRELGRPAYRIAVLDTPPQQAISEASN